MFKRIMKWLLNYGIAAMCFWLPYWITGDSKLSSRPLLFVIVFRGVLWMLTAFVIQGIWWGLKTLYKFVFSTPESE